jgi:hypothetical protein
MRRRVFIFHNHRWPRFPEFKIGLEMKSYVGVTDNDWFAFLSQQPEIDEINFWQ